MSSMSWSIYFFFFPKEWSCFIISCYYCRCYLEERSLNMDQPWKDDFSVLAESQLGSTKQCRFSCKHLSQARFVAANPGKPANFCFHICSLAMSCHLVGAGLRWAHQYLCLHHAWCPWYFCNSNKHRLDKAAESYGGSTSHYTQPTFLFTSHISEILKTWCTQIKQQWDLRLNIMLLTVVCNTESSPINTIIFTLLSPPTQIYLAQLIQGCIFMHVYPKEISGRRKLFQFLPSAKAA